MAGSPGVRPIVVVALAIVAIIGPPLVVDLWRFAKREAEYRKFRRLHAGDYDTYLRPDWTSHEQRELSERLMRERDRR